jgi:hypothetical protein
MREVYEQRARANRTFATNVGILFEDLADACIQMADNLTTGQEAIIRIFALSDMAKICLGKHAEHYKILIDESILWATDGIPKEEFDD